MIDTLGFITTYIAHIALSLRTRLIAISCVNALKSHTWWKPEVNDRTRARSPQEIRRVVKGREPYNRCVKMRRNTLDIKRIPTLMTIDKVLHVLKV